MNIRKFRTYIRNDVLKLCPIGNDDMSIFIQPWNKGFKIHTSFRGDGIQPKKFEIDLFHLNLVTAHQLRETDSPMGIFLSRIPKEILSPVKNIQYLQYHLLRTAATVKAARELITNGYIILLWAKLYSVIDHFESWLATLAEKELSHSYARILRDIYGVKTKSDLKLLKKIIYQDAGADDICVIYNFFKTQTFSKKINHLRRVPCDLLRAFLDCPEFIISPIYIKKLNDLSLSDESIYSEIYVLIDMQVHILDMLSRLGNPVASQSLRQIRSENQMQILHDRVLERYLEHQQHTAHNNIVFPNPPIPDLSGKIEAIKCSADLKREGIHLHHCVGHMFPDRENFFYRILGSDRCTLHLRKGKAIKKYSIRQLKSFYNTEPKPDTVTMIQSWLDEHQQPRSVMK